MLPTCKYIYVGSRFVLLKIETSNTQQLSICDFAQFYKLEDLGIKEDPTAPDEDIALEHFHRTLRYDEGRYFASFPWNEFPPPISTNYRVAKGILDSQLEKLNCNPSLFIAYHNQIMENLRLGIIEIVPDNKIFKPSAHYIPHHGVFQEDKLRIVYNASAKTDKNPSLNDCIHRGPLLLENLCSLLIEFCFHTIVLLADIEKAFLQIDLNKEDQDYVCFLWVDNDGNIVVFCFKRVPFGVNASPFLLNAVIKTHLETSKYPIMKKIKAKWYADNMVTRADNVEEALEIYKHAKELINNASMNLRHWISNLTKYVNR